MKSDQKSRWNRNPAVDIMKGIAILLVIVGHNDELPHISEWRCVIMSFHMPLFFILSGYFIKGSTKKLLSVIKKDARRLLVPYFAVMALLCGYAYLIHYVLFDDHENALSTFWATMYPSGVKEFANSVPVWFLCALFFARNIIKSVLAIIPFVGFAVLVIISLLATWYCNQIDAELPFAFMEGLSAIVFVLLGMWVQRCNSIACDAGYMKALVLVAAIGAWLLACVYGDVSMVNGHYKSYLLSVAGACGGTYCVYRISVMLAKVSYINKILQWIGVNSLVILCAHTVERYIPQWRCILPNVYMVLMCEIVICMVAAAFARRFAITRGIFSV